MDFLQTGQQSEDTEDDCIELDVLEENEIAVHIFSRCSMSYLTSMAGAQAVGFTAVEVLAAAQGMQIDLRQHPRAFEHVMEMGRFAAKALNQRTG